MNSDQRDYGQNNQHHDGSCGCGCQQKNEESNQNQYISNEQIHLNHSGSCGYQQETTYPVANESIGNYDGYKNTNYSKYSGCNLTQFNNIRADLPVESTMFQRITNIDNNNDHAMDAMNISVGTGLDAAGGCLRQITVENTIVNERTNTDNESQFFIFYETDSGDFVIANRGNGRVLEMVDFPGIDRLWHRLLVSRLYENKPTQMFQKRSVTTTNFQLITKVDNEIFGIQNCNNNPNAWQIYTTVNERESTGFRNNTYEFRDSQLIGLPSLQSRETLAPPPLLTSRYDTGINPENAPRAVEGSTLVPAIAVNDVLPVAQRMTQSPYYVLTRNTYWHRLFSIEIPSATNRTMTETLFAPIQSTMNSILGMTIGADFGLQFPANSNTNPFQNTIRNGLNTRFSSTNTQLGDITREYTFSNRGNATRLVQYVKADEYVLKRMDGSQVAQPWVALNSNIDIMRTCADPSGAGPACSGGVYLTLEKEKIICADNSYDLSVWKTPKVIRDGEIYIKNKCNSKPY